MGSGITILVLIIVVVTLILSVLIYRRNRKRDTVTKDSIIKNDRLAEPCTYSIELQSGGYTLIKLFLP